MSKTATKAVDNVFYKARMATAECNDKCNSREGAAEELGIDRTRLARIELGSINPYPEEVLLMADTYNAPELMNYYCYKMCPLGRKTVQPAELKGIDRITIQLITALGQSDCIKREILEIAEDGIISQDEKPRVQEIAAILDRISLAARELRLFIDKNMGR